MDKKPFIHLRTQSSYSLSESAIKIDNLVELTKNNLMPAVALTDNNNMFGALEFSLKSINTGIQPIIGTSINYLINDPSSNLNKQKTQITLLSKNEVGYKNLLYLSSLSHINSNLGFPYLKTEDIFKYKEGLIVYFGGIYNPLLDLFNKNKMNDLKNLITIFKKEFNENLFFELQRINNSDIDNFEENFINLSLDYNIPLIATNNVQYPTKDYFESHDSLICISEKSRIDHENRKKSNPNFYFKSSDEMYELFTDIPVAVENTFLVSIKCNYSPTSQPPKLPKFDSNSNLTEIEELNKDSIKGLEKRFLIQPDTFDENIIDKYKKRLNYELNIINEMGFSGYFLIVADFINWAKKNNIPVGPGRGSGAGSLVAWSLSITDLDPIKYGLIFERFLNPERVSLPDLDIDICQNRRDEVIDYIAEKYGNNSVAHIITFGTLASRAVVRDLGRVHGVPYGEIDKFTKLIPYNPSNPMTLKKSIKIEPSLKNAIKNDDRLQKIIDQGLKLEGLYRHASTHASGVVISDENLQSIIPLYKDVKANKINTQFSMDYIEKSGLIKFDFLGLTTLTILNKATELINKFDSKFNIKSIPIDDKKTFEMLSLGQTSGVFQLESNGMKDVLKRLKPDRFEDIIAVVALFRPGPMENISSFCNRKHEIEKIDYLHNLLEPALKETYGIIVYQEQVMEIAQILSGYSLGEADILRKAMGKKIPKIMEEQKNKFVEGAKLKGLSNTQASSIFDLVSEFAGYGFNKSHAAGYAKIAYQTAYLKAHFPEEFIVASMNLSINKTENIVMFKKEIDDLGIDFLKPDINHSQTEFSIEMNQENKKCIRFGLAAVKGVGYNAMDNLVLERNKNGNFINIVDFVSRLKTDVINKKQLEKLAQSGSFDSIEKNRSFIFENVINLISISNNINKNTDQESLFSNKDIKKEYSNNLKNAEFWPDQKKLMNELEVIGFYFSEHPISLYPEQLFPMLNISNYESIINDNNCIKAKVVGSILDIKERTSKDGNKYAFITISDKKNQYELTIFGDVFRNYFQLIKEGNILIFDIDLVSNKDRSRRLIVRKIEFLEKIISTNNFIQKIGINDLKDIALIKDHLISKEHNKNTIFISFQKNDLTINIELPSNLTISNEIEFDKVLKYNKISRSLTLNN